MPTLCACLLIYKIQCFPALKFYGAIYIGYIDRGQSDIPTVSVRVSCP